MRKRRALGIAAGTVLLVTTVGLVLILDGSPTLPPREAPTGAEVRIGRDALKRTREALRAAPPTATIAYSDEDFRGIAALAGNALRVRRVVVGVEGDSVVAGASLRLPLGLWLNARAATVNRSDGFPALDVRLGALDLPRWLTRAALGTMRGIAVFRGARLPPLDVLVRSLAVADERAELTVAAPLENSGLVRQVAALGGAPVDTTRVVSLYCDLVAEHARQPDLDFTTQVRRVMRMGSPGGVAEAVAENRAAMVALAMMTVGVRAGDLAGSAATDARRCPFDPPGFTLAGRADLAKHWSLSAALGATVGGNFTRAMGEWKELSDSLPGGSGFSFVDLTADRAGRRIGGAATSPGKALALRAALADAEGETLLPIDAALFREGMTNGEFVARYGNIDSKNFSHAVRQIDDLLDRDPLLRAAR